MGTMSFYCSHTPLPFCNPALPEWWKVHLVCICRSGDARLLAEPESLSCHHSHYHHSYHHPLDHSLEVLSEEKSYIWIIVETTGRVFHQALNPSASLIYIKHEKQHNMVIIWICDVFNLTAIDWKEWEDVIKCNIERKIPQQNICFLFSGWHRPTWESCGFTFVHDYVIFYTFMSMKTSQFPWL